MRERAQEPSAGSDPLDEAQAHDVLVALLPVLRGAMAAEGAKVLLVDRCADALDFVCRADAPQLSLFC